MNNYDLLIIGSGPAGLSAAIYAARAELNFAVIERSAVTGGQVQSTYEVDNYPGIPGVSGPELSEKMHQHCEKLGVHFITEDVVRITHDDGIFTITTSDNNTYTSRAAIAATGASHRKLECPGEAELSGMGVSYCATCDGAFYKGRTVAVNGGGNTAVEDAIYLAGIVDKVYLIHRRNEFRADEVLVNAAKALPNLEIVTPYTIESLLGEPKLTGVELVSKEDGSKKIIDVDGLFVAIGQEPKTADFKDLVTLQGGYIEAGENCKTNVEGIFAAGDARVKKVRQLTTACADGAVAALAAIDYIKLGV